MKSLTKIVNLKTMESTIYSIGHGNKKIEDFIDELKNYEISYVLDVRPNPFQNGIRNSISLH